MLLEMFLQHDVNADYYISLYENEIPRKVKIIGFVVCVALLFFYTIYLLLTTFSIKTTVQVCSFTWKETKINFGKRVYQDQRKGKQEIWNEQYNSGRKESQTK